ncbi:MAG: RNA polymerase sigma factor [Sedimentisphaerales bacterium]|nr:RNA polymerase sigma factor [Sedimentisphaerales bacterium]
MKGMGSERRQNEAVLACAAREGDREALRELLVRNWGWLRGLVYSVVGGAQDVDDCLQDICVRVLDKIDSLRELERFRPWLAVIARRQALKFRRQRRRRPVSLDEEAVKGWADERAEGFIENMERAERCRQILEATAALPQKYREVFVLAHSSELTYGQMAEVLDVPVTTMQIRLARARKMILNKVTSNSKNRVAER